MKVVSRPRKEEDNDHSGGGEKKELPLRQAKVLAITAMMLQNKEDDYTSVNGSSNTISSDEDDEQEQPPLPTTRDRTTTKKCSRSTTATKNKVPKKAKVLIHKRTPVREAAMSEKMSSICLVTPDNSEIPMKKTRKSSRHKNRDTFPVKLWKLLESGTCSDTIHWTCDGKAFIIRDKRTLAHILPLAGFAHSGLRSFHRQLSYWCFTRSCKDSDKEVWGHPHFCRGMTREDLAAVLRVGHKGNPMRRKGMTLQESAAHLDAFCSSSDSVTMSRANRRAEVTSMDVSSSSAPPPTTTSAVMPEPNSNVSALVSPMEERSSTLENRKAHPMERPQHQQPTTVTSTTRQPRRIDFDDEELMSPEETSFLLSVTIPVGEDLMNEALVLHIPLGHDPMMSISIPVGQDHLHCVSPPVEHEHLPSVTPPVELEPMYEAMGNEAIGADHDEYDVCDSFLPIVEIMQEFKESNVTVSDLSVCSWVSNFVEMDEDILQKLPFNDTGAVSLCDDEDFMSLQDFSFLDNEESTTISV